MNSINRIINYIKQIFPFYLFLIAILPSIIAIFIDYELFNFKYLIINIIWLIFFTSLAYILKSKLLYKITTLIFFVFGFIEITHWLILKGPLTLTSLVVLSNTNTMEANEFIATKANFSLLILIPFILFFYTIT